MKESIKRNDLVVYSVSNVPRVGIVKRINEYGHIVIVPIKKGNIIKKEIKEVLRVEDIKRGIW